LRKTDFSFDWNEDSKIYELWPELIKDEKRNRIIQEGISDGVGKGRFPLILTERREHLEILVSLLKGKIEQIAVLQGGMRAKKRREILEGISCPDNGQELSLLIFSHTMRRTARMKGQQKKQ